MNNKNKSLPTIPVFKYFEDIAKIPRCSGNEKAISDYLVNFAKSKNLKVEQDNTLNVLIKKPASSGYENAPIVILQGHMDMVCDKINISQHDFKKDSIEFKIKKDMLYAKDTTLGADNGIAIAYCLSILESNIIPHPPLRVLMTTGEEIGLRGVSALNPSFLKGDFLINLDCEQEGVLFSSSAGGVRIRHYIPVTWEDIEENYISYLIKINGLRGGHSGIDINKNRGNSNKLMGRFLNDLINKIDYHLIRINGGSKRNAIPHETEAKILISLSDRRKLEVKINEWNQILKNEFRISDPDISINIERIKINDIKVIKSDTLKKIINLLLILPNGAQTMSSEFQELVESSINIGVIKTLNSGILFESSIRSNIKSLKDSILEQLRVMSGILNVSFESDLDYPEWEYQPNSKLREICRKVYKKMCKREPKITAIHAGLECGFFKKKNKNLDIVSIGPDMYDVHSPNEHISISSIERNWEYLLRILKEIT
jgi:dipeptidase D